MTHNIYVYTKTEEYVSCYNVSPLTELKSPSKLWFESPDRRRISDRNIFRTINQQWDNIQAKSKLLKKNHALCFVLEAKQKR